MCYFGILFTSGSLCSTWRIIAFIVVLDNIFQRLTRKKLQITDFSIRINLSWQCVKRFAWNHEDCVTLEPEDEFQYCQVWGVKNVNCTSQSKFSFYCCISKAYGIWSYKCFLSEFGSDESKQKLHTCDFKIKVFINCLWFFHIKKKKIIHSHRCHPWKEVWINIYRVPLQKNTKHVQIGLDQVTMWPHRRTIRNGIIRLGENHRTGLEKRWWGLFCFQKGNVDT